MSEEERDPDDPGAVVEEVEVEVRYAETDQMGVVHHASYIVWFELARTALCRASGYPYAAIEEMGYYLVVSQVEARYGAPARYGDTLRVSCRIAALASRGLRFAYEVRRGEERLARGATEHIWVDKATGRPCRAPGPLREPFRRLAGDVEVR